MASKEYAYFIKGANEIGVIERDTKDGGGLTSPSSVPSINIPNSFAKWKSPQSTEEDSLEIQYTYIPDYQIGYKGGFSQGHKPLAWGSDGENLILIFLNTAGNGYDMTSNLPVGTNIYLTGSGQWDGIHTVKDTSLAGTDLGIIILETPYRRLSAMFTCDVSFNLAEYFEGYNTDATRDLIMLANDQIHMENNYVYITGAANQNQNGGLFKVSYTADSDRVNTLIKYKMTASDWLGPVVESAVSNATDTNDEVTIYNVIKRNNMRAYENVTLMEDESFEVDLPRYYNLALVYYVKAKVAEEALEIEIAELWMSKFRKILEKKNNANVPGPRKIMPGSGAII